jgi:hypothetical protein
VLPFDRKRKISEQFHFFIRNARLKGKNSFFNGAPHLPMANLIKTDRIVQNTISCLFIFFSVDKDRGPADSFVPKTCRISPRNGPNKK